MTNHSDDCNNAGVPELDVVLYDGRCALCTGQIRRLKRFDAGGRLRFLSLHDPRVAQCYPDLPKSQLMHEMHLIDRSGQCHRGAAALRVVTRRLPRLWWLAVPLHIPGSLPLWQWLYQLIASRRYRFGMVEDCASGSCSRDHGRDTAENKLPHRQSSELGN